MSLTDHSHEQGTILVTGARGFIGTHLTRRLRERSAIGNGAIGPIVGLVRGGAGEGEVACDLHDADAVEALVRKLRPAACIHAAWEIDPAKYRNDERNDRWTVTTLGLASSLERHGCRWLGVFGTCIETAVADESSCRYALAKTRLREALLASPIGDRLCWWKLFQPYGPGEPAIRFVPSMLRTLATRQPFTVNAPADVRDFIHVSDIAECAIASLHRRATGVFELGTGDGTSLEDAARIAAGLLGAERCVRTRSITDAERAKASAIVADPTSLAELTGWQPRIELRGGLSALIARAKAPSSGYASPGGVHAA